MSAPAGPSNPSLVTGRIRDTDQVVNAQGKRKAEEDAEDGGEVVVNKNKRHRKDKRELSLLNRYRSDRDAVLIHIVFTAVPVEFDTAYL
jgi:hypothetical protein